MPFRRLVWLLVELCLLWSVVLTGLAALGNTWVLDRVAGGIYAGESMPAGVRVTYLLTALVTLVVMWIERRLYARRAGRVLRVLGWVVVVVFALSAVVNALSPSAPERWNALPAAIIVIGTVILLRRAD